MRNSMLCCLFLAATAGCTSRVDSAIQQQRELNRTTAEAVDRANDLRSLTNAMQAFSQKKLLILDQLNLEPQKQRKAILGRFEASTKDSHDRLALALGEFAVRHESERPGPVVRMETTLGSIELELFETFAPITVKNFLDYVDDKFYDGTIFHRVKKEFMIQGGGFLPGMKRKPTRGPIENESYNGLSNEAGTLAMARSEGANSATSEFFINLGDNKYLDRIGSGDAIGYAVFGKVIRGMEAAIKIVAVQTAEVGSHQNVPVENVVIQSIRRVGNDR